MFFLLVVRDVAALALPELAALVAVQVIPAMLVALEILEITAPPERQALLAAEAVRVVRVTTEPHQPFRAMEVRVVQAELAEGVMLAHPEVPEAQTLAVREALGVLQQMVTGVLVVMAVGLL